MYKTESVKFISQVQSSANYHERTKEGERNADGGTQEGFMEEVTFLLGWQMTSSIY